VAQDWDWVDDDSGWVPPPVDTTSPSVARIYDYALGGKDNYPVDREVADRIWAVVPDGHDVARANRRFLLRAVEDMARAGVRQFIDLGTGIPTSPNVHETVWQVEPRARFVYVDNDPLVLAHNRALLHAEPRVVVLPHDLRDPAAVLDDPATRGLLDLDQPVGLLMIAVLHFVDLTAAPHVVARYRHALAPGSRIAISAVTSDGVAPERVRGTLDAYAKVSATLVFRTRAEVEALFDGLDLAEPLADVYRSPHMAVLGGVAVTG